MTDKEEFEEFDKIWGITVRTNVPALKEIKQFAFKWWLEKAHRDREKVAEAVNDVLSYSLPYLAEKRLRELLEEMR